MGVASKGATSRRAARCDKVFSLIVDLAFSGRSTVESVAGATLMHRLGSFPNNHPGRLAGMNRADFALRRPRRTGSLPRCRNVRMRLPAADNDGGAISHTIRNRCEAAPTYPVASAGSLPCAGTASSRGSTLRRARAISSMCSISIDGSPLTSSTPKCSPASESNTSRGASS